MAQKSVRVGNRVATAEFVKSSIHTHKQPIAEALTAIDQQLPDPVQLGEPGLARLFDWLGAVLSRSTDALGTAEAAYVREQADAPPARQQRDDNASTVLDQLSRLRTRLEMFLGAGKLADYGLSERPPRPPKSLEQYGLIVLDLMRQKPVKMTDDLGSELDTERMADRLEQKLRVLSLSLSTVSRERRELEATMLERDRMLEAWERAYGGVATTVTGLYRLAGRHDLAQRVRPTARRATGVDLGPPPATDEPAEPDAAAEEDSKTALIVV